MFKALSRDFLDGDNLENIEKEFNIKSLVIEDFYSTKEFMDFIKNS